MNDQLRKLSGLLSNFTDTGRSILSYLGVDVLKAVQNSWENLSFNDDFCKVNGVLGDLGKALAHVTLELGIGVGDERS